MSLQPPKDNWSRKFISAMKARCIHGFHRYGSAKENSATTDMLENALVRIRKYQETGNTEWLVDAGNFLMFEFMYPRNSQAHFRATSHSESPGITGESARSFRERFYRHDGG